MSGDVHPALAPQPGLELPDLEPLELLAWPPGLAPPLLLDVREDWEVEYCAIRGSVCIPLGELSARLGELDRERTIVAVCHHGLRSAAAARFLLSQGFAQVFNLRGGIDAWAASVDTGMRRY